MAINTDNANTFPISTQGLMIQYPDPAISIPVNGNSKIAVLSPPIQILNMPQVIGLVPLFPCEGDCRYGLYGGDIIPDDRDFILPVFADQGDIDTYKNDYNSWLISYPTGYNPITNGDFKLQKQDNLGQWQDAATISDNTYGTLYNNNFCGTTRSGSLAGCSNFNYYGYKVQWKPVLAAYGEGIYRFKVSGVYTPHYAYCMASPPFCLKAWSCLGVNGTVRFESEYSGGRFGSVDTQGIEWSLCCSCLVTADRAISIPIIWNDSIRFFGFFGYETAEYQRDSIKYQTGVINKIRDEAIKNFSFRTDKLPLWLHKRFYSYGLMADKLFVSDYNLNNADYNVKHFYIVANSSYSPKYNTWSRYMKVIDVKFQEGQQYVFRDRCCSTPLPVII